MERVALLIAVLVFYCRTTFAASVFDPCQNIQCGDNRECYLGKCFNTFSSADCKDSCLQNQQCTFGECASLLVNDTATCNSLCRESEECRFGQCYTALTAPCTSCSSSSQCLLGTCVQNTNLCSQCTQAQWCGTGGTCVNFSPNASCQACRQNEVCTYGACVPLSSTLNFASPCRDNCLRNQQCVNLASDEDAPNWQCVYANGACNQCLSLENETASVCSYGTCLQCDFCEDITDMFVLNLMHLDLIKTNFTPQSIEINSTNVPLVFEDGTLAVTQGLRTPNSFATRWQSLVFGTSVSNGTAVFGISPGATIEIQNQTHYLSTSAIIIGKGSVLQNTVWKISDNADVIVAFDSASIDLEMARLVTFELQLSGRLIVVGEGSLNLPQDVSKFRAFPSSSFLVSGSAALSGDLSAIPLVVSPFGPYPAEMRVTSNSVLRSSNNLLGQRSRILVLGTLITSGLIIQPTLHVGSGGILALQGPALKAGNLLLSPGGQLEVNSLGSSTYFSEIQTCAEGASISYKLNDTLENHFHHCNDVEICSGVILRYAPTTFRNVGKFACSIKLQDTLGARMTLVLYNSTKPFMQGLGGAISNYAVFDTTSLFFYVQNAEADVAPPSGGLSSFSKSMLGFGIMGAFFISCVAATVCYRRKKKKREEKYLLESDDEPLPRAALNYDNYSSMASSSHSES